MENFYLKNKEKDTLLAIKMFKRNIAETIVGLRDNAVLPDIEDESESKFDCYEYFEENKKVFKLIDALNHYANNFKEELLELENIQESIHYNNRFNYIEPLFEEKMDILREYIQTEECKKYEFGIFYKLSNLFDDWKEELKDIEGVNFLEKEEREALSNIMIMELRKILNFSDIESFDLKQYLKIYLDFNSNGSMYRVLDFDFDKYFEGILRESIDKERITEMIHSLKEGDFNIKANLVKNTILQIEEL